MELDRAKEIAQALANGVDPYTGEHFPADGPYQNADTVRALFMILEAIESGNKSNLGAEREPKSTDQECVIHDGLQLEPPLKPEYVSDEILSNDSLHKILCAIRAARWSLAEQCEREKVKGHAALENCLRRESPWSERYCDPPQVEEAIEFSTFMGFTPPRARFLHKAYSNARAAVAEEWSWDLGRNGDLDCYDVQNREDSLSAYPGYEAVRKFCLACDAAINELVDALNSTPPSGRSKSDDEKG